MISEKFITNLDKFRWKKGKMQKSLLSRGTKSVWIFVSLGRTAHCCVFFVFRRICGYVLHDVVLPHAAPIFEEHLVHLLLIIFTQCLLLSSESDSELLKLFLLNLGCYPEIIELILQLIHLLPNALAFVLCNLFILFHLASLNLRRLHHLLQFPHSLLYIGNCYPDCDQLALYPTKLSTEFFIGIYLSGKKYLHTLHNL